MQIVDSPNRPSQKTMVIPNLSFHHLGLAVRQPQPAKAFVSVLGYFVGETVFDQEQNVFAILCTHNTEPAIEILWPGQTTGPLDAVINRRPSGIIYHICYETNNLSEALNDFEKNGNRVICISPPQPAPLFSNRQVSFYNIMGIGLVELLS